MHRVQVHISVREHYAFGIGAGATGVEKFRQGIFINAGDVREMGRGGGQKLVVVLGAEPGRCGSAVELANQLDRGNLFAKCFGDGEELFFHEESGSAGIVEDVAEFAGREANIQREQHGAGFQNAVIRFEQAMAIAAEERDPLAGLYAGLAQSSRQAADAIGHLRVGISVVIANNGGAVGILLHRVTQETQGREWNIHSALA